MTYNLWFSEKLADQIVTTGNIGEGSLFEGDENNDQGYFIVIDREGSFYQANFCTDDNEYPDSEFKDFELVSSFEDENDVKLLIDSAGILDECLLEEIGLADIKSVKDIKTQISNFLEPIKQENNSTSVLKSTSDKNKPKF